MFRGYSKKVFSSPGAFFAGNLVAEKRREEEKGKGGKGEGEEREEEREGERGGRGGERRGRGGNSQDPNLPGSTAAQPGRTWQNKKSL